MTPKLGAAWARSGYAKEAAMKWHLERLLAVVVMTLLALLLTGCLGERATVVEAGGGRLVLRLADGRVLETSSYRYEGEGALSVGMCVLWEYGSESRPVGVLLRSCE